MRKDLAEEKQNTLNRRNFILKGTLATAATVIGTSSVAMLPDKKLNNPKNKEDKMGPNYSTKDTALLCIDFYNDFLSEGGKLWPMLEETATEVGLLDNLRKIVQTAREEGITIYHVPHHRWEPGDYAKWKYPMKAQQTASVRQVFAKDTWGGTFHDDFPVKQGDVIVSEHWGSSGFANTNLEHQLRQNGHEKIICIGLIANTCIEATARFGMEYGFHVTIIKDATAAFSKEAMHAAHEINGPSYAHEILTSSELITALKKY